MNALPIGSPPRVRGKLEHLTSLRLDERITPARAGKTYPRPRNTPSHRDHPRACGENRRVRRFGRSLSGSPPRVRGKRGGHGARFIGGGITPARAGKTACRKSLRNAGWDHPRACGENAVRPTGGQHTRGSPPRVRGKLCAGDQLLRSDRITPARAGKTVFLHPNGGHYTDHPRACGENSRIGSRPTFQPGSPPRVRGKHADVKIELYDRRITPARAGKTGREP